MTNSDAEKNAGPTVETLTEPSWKWLQGRIPRTRLELYSHWLSEDLAELEGRFSSFVTKRSRTLAFRSDMNTEQKR